MEPRRILIAVSKASISMAMAATLAGALLKKMNIVAVVVHCEMVNPMALWDIDKLDEAELVDLKYFIAEHSTCQP